MKPEYRLSIRGFHFGDKAEDEQKNGFAKPSLTDTAMSEQQSDFQADSAYERIRLTGENILAELKKIIRAGNARKLIVKDADGKELFSTSLTLGAGGAAGFMLLHPVLATVASLLMIYNNIQVIVEHEPASGDEYEIAMDEDDKG